LPPHEILPSTAVHTTQRESIMGFKYGVTNGWKSDAQGWKMGWKV
jgi:hypothetical protein